LITGGAAICLQKWELSATKYVPQKNVKGIKYSLSDVFFQALNAADASKLIFGQGSAPDTLRRSLGLPSRLGGVGPFPYSYPLNAFGVEGVRVWEGAKG